MKESKTQQAIRLMRENPGMSQYKACQIVGVEGVEEAKTGLYADYLNTGDTYAPTVIYWRGAYRVQSLGDFVEIQERQGYRF